MKITQAADRVKIRRSNVFPARGSVLIAGALLTPMDTDPLQLGTHGLRFIRAAVPASSSAGCAPGGHRLAGDRGDRVQPLQHPRATRTRHLRPAQR